MGIEQVKAVCEALQNRGMLPMPSSGDRMITCDAELQSVLGVSAIPFYNLEEALSLHVQPAEPPVLDATVP